MDYGENVRSRKYQNQVKEIMVRVVVYNLERIMKKELCFILLEEFYIAKCFFLTSAYLCQLEEVYCTHVCCLFYLKGQIF